MDSRGRRRSGRLGDMPFPRQKRIYGDIFETVPTTERAAMRALALHAQLLHDTSRGRIASEVTSLNTMEPKLAERVVDERTSRFGSKSLSPIGDAYPVSKFSVRMRQRQAKADGTEQLAGWRVLADGQHEVLAALPGVRMRADPLRATVGRIGVWNRQRRIRDLTNASQPLDYRAIADSELAEDNAIGFESRGFLHDVQRSPGVT